jgi:hypothetical protein
MSKKNSICHRSGRVAEFFGLLILTVNSEIALANSSAGGGTPCTTPPGSGTVGTEFIMWQPAGSGHAWEPMGSPSQQMRTAQNRVELVNYCVRLGLTNTISNPHCSGTMHSVQIKLLKANSSTAIVNSTIAPGIPINNTVMTGQLWCEQAVPKSTLASLRVELQGQDVMPAAMVKALAMPCPVGANVTISQAMSKMTAPLPLPGKFGCVPNRPILQVQQKM